MIESLLAELHEQIRDLRARMGALEKSIERIEKWIAIEDYRRTSVVLTKTDVLKSILLWIALFVSGFGAGDAIERIR